MFYFCNEKRNTGEPLADRYDEDESSLNPSPGASLAERFAVNTGATDLALLSLPRF